MKNNYIALMIEDSPGLPAGVLGILKSGNCFVPINTLFPLHRIKFIIEDCQIEILITDKANFEKARQIVKKIPIIRHIICIDDQIGNVNNEVLTNEVVKSSYCYVIYTSGSTGQPKGVPITHRNVVPLFEWFREYFHLGVETRVMQNLSYTFDFGVFEILTTVLYGGRLYIIDKRAIGDYSRYAQFIERHQVNTLHTTPVFFNNVAASGQKMSSIYLLHLGGERLTGQLIKKALEVTSPGCFIYNGYGPTEATINCSIYSVPGSSSEGRENIPIGCPSAFHRIYILNSYFQVQPIGAAGELCIGGPGLADGYLNRPELTKQKFLEVQEPFFKKVPGPRREKIYCTGDLVRWLPSGEVEFLGRIDHQVKVRGFRIELGEIENKLAHHPLIKEVAVLARQHENGSNFLAAYIVTKDDIRLPVSELREFLGNELPDYMIPAYFLYLERFPLTGTGKIDRKALPEPGLSFIDTGTEFIAPASETEKRLVSIWQQVLRLEKIGILDDFFQLGGDSILVNQCIALIREELQVEIPLRKFFEKPLIKALAEEIVKKERQVDSIKPVERKGEMSEIPLSFAQERLWFLQELDADNVAYFVPRVIRISGNLDSSLIERTFSEIIRRHEILRTVFPTIEGQPVQRIKPPFLFKIPLLDWSNLEKNEQEKKVAQFLSEEDHRAFDFEKGPLLRVTIIKLKAEEHLFVLTEHHLIHDGWTQGVLLKEFIAIFSSYVENKEHHLPPLPIQYANFAIWQRQHLTGEVLERHLCYWQEKLIGLAPFLELPSDRPRPPVISGKGELQIVRMPGAETVRLKEFSRKHGVTLFMTMLAVFKTLLYRYTGVEDLCVGTGIANRRYKEMEGMLGMVINTLPLRTQVEGGIPFKECLNRIKETCLEAYQHEDTPFGKIVERLQPERNLSYTPLFQVMFTFMDTPAERLHLPGLELELLPAHNRSAKFDINIVVAPPLDEEDANAETLVEWEYNTDIFDASTIRRMIDHYNRLLEESLKQPGIILANLALLSGEELKQVLFEFNNTETSYPHDKTIPELFAEQAAQTPDYIALFAREIRETREKHEKHEKHVETLRATSLQQIQQITYRQLNEQSNRLAGSLIEKGVLPDDIVGIMIERSAELIIGILGILKAGGAYLPIDPDYPQERIDYILKDSKAKILIINKSEIRNPKLETNPNETNSNDLNKNQNSGVALVLNFKHLNFDIVSNFDIRASDFNSLNLAYIIYTSGSTGKPKGVVIEHRGVVNLCHWHIGYYGLTNRDHVSQYAGCGFDASVWEIFPALTVGASLHIIADKIRLDMGLLNAFFEKHNITISFLPTPACRQFINSKQENHSLRIMLTGGDKLQGYIKRNYRLYNNYGPTENTVVTTAYPLDADCQNIPVGKPIANTQVYILQKDGRQLQPVGTAGELCIAGDGLSRGYLNNPELTADRFKRNVISQWSFVNGNFQRNGNSSNPPNDHCSMTNDYFYCTGDLVRWLPDGNIEFLGRIDQQVKIRGFRIELGEIEGCLRKHNHVKDAVVIDRKVNEDKCLYAYIVPQDKNNAPGINELKIFLQESLPDYMIPAYFIFIDKIPLNPNGKVDRKALPEAEIGEMTKKYTAPRDEIEKKLVEIWADVLKTQTVMSIDDNFFDLGGHSLNATILTARIHKVFHVKIPLKEFFQRGCIREIAEYLRKAVKEQFTAVEPLEKKEYYPLSTAQKRMYLLYRMDENSTAYNIPAVVTLDGTLDINRLEGVFKQLIWRHESLRTSFITANEEPMQKIHEDIEFSIEILPNLESFIRPFDLSKAPLVHVGLIKTGHDSHIVIMDIHHIAADGTSMGILYGEMMTIYQGKELTPLETTYKDYATWQNNPQNREILKLQEKSWLERFAGEIPVLNLPTDYHRPPVQDFAGNRIEFELETAETSSLKKLAQHHDATLFIVLLAACNIWFSKLSGEEDIVIGSPTAARRHAEVQNIVGMFVNTLPLRNFPISDKTFTCFLQDVKERTWQAFQDQDYPFEELVEKIVVKRDTSRNPLFDVMLGFQNMDIPVIDVPGLVLRPYKLEIKTAKFDLNLSGREQDSRLIFNLEYAAKLFKEESIHKFTGYLRNIIHAVITNPTVRIADISIITDEDKEKILALSTGPSAPIDFDETIHGWFEKIVLKNVHQTALVFKNSRITYTELNRRANALAWLLREKGVGPDKVVGLMVGRSFEMVIGMLAVMKAGGAYLPIDTKLPGQRKQIIIEDTKISVLLTNDDIEKDTCCKNRSTGNLPIIANGQTLVYVLFTSGSTGKPKGVMMDHTNLVNLIIFHHKYTNIDCSKVLQFATISFDASFHEIFSSLLAGGELYLIPEETRNHISELFQFINKNKIKTLFLPMSFIKLIFSQDDYISIFQGSVEHIQTAGEQVIVDDKFRNYLNKHHIYLHNHYGPSETHVVTTLTMNPTANIPEFPTIGKPVMNTLIYILDKGRHLQPVGIAGELYAGGFQVGRGYLNRPELTADRFDQDLWDEKDGLDKKKNEDYQKFFRGSRGAILQKSPPCCHRYYKTGDLARWLENGNIEFLGRSDHQVKIRGIRVEPGEIESRLQKIRFVEDAVVVVKNQASGDKYLCAYVVIKAGESDPGLLRNLLSVDLPDYMIPAYFIPVTKIPLTPSGKVDRRALPEPELSTTAVYALPNDEIELKLVDLWADILNKKSLSIDDNFFQLGGHSLKATLLISRIHKEFNVKIQLVEIFKRPTVRELAGYIRNTKTSPFISLKPVQTSEYYTLSSPQRRLYILQQMGKNSTAYNLPTVFELEGTPDIKKITNTFEKLISRHESFRTSFHMVAGQPIQKIHPAAGIEFSISYSEIPIAAGPLFLSQMISVFIRAFDLATAPLLRVKLLKLPGSKYILMLDMHHIISDGTSLGILAKEFMALYSGIELSPLTIQYKDYAVYQGNKEMKNLLQVQEEYWLNEYSDTRPVLDLPLDYSRPAVQSFEGSSVRFELETCELEKLIILTREVNVTLYMALLAIYSLFLSRLSGQEDVIIGAPTAGRRHVELTPIIGMFVNTLALRFYPTNHKTFKEFLGELKNKTLEAFENQEYPFEDLVERVVFNRDTGRNPLFDVVFILQNQDIPALEVPGLKLRPYPFETKIAKFDLTLAASEGENESGQKTVRFEWEYCTQLFNEDTISRFIVYFKKILNTVIENRDMQLGNLEIITETEKHQIIYEFNNTGADYPRDKTIHELFAEQVAQTPNYIALFARETRETHEKHEKHVATLRATSLQQIQQITYRQLNEQSNRLAGLLIEKGVLPDDIVGIMMERSAELIIGILGILKAGGAYLPIDAEYPQERIDYILKDSKAKILIINKSEIRNPKLETNPNKTNSNDQNKNDNFGNLFVLNFKHLNFDIVSNFDIRASNFNSLNLAYIIYTSGSTGQPKGVMVEHRSVVNLAISQKKQFNINEKDRVLQFSSICFDASVEQIFITFFSGAVLVLVDKNTLLDHTKFEELIARQSITHLHAVPSFLNSISLKQRYQLKRVIAGGDTCPLTLAQKYSVFCHFYNEYGPTETTVTSIEMLYSNVNDILSIGKPIANTFVYICDKWLNPVPPGTPGEMYIGGEGVARGYLNNPELTAERFKRIVIRHSSFVINTSSILTNDHCPMTNDRLYKTGDRTRWLPNGNIEFLGRIDQQVKIRGFRIELGEIENCLLKHKNIKEAAVIDKKFQDEKIICAYFVPVNEVDITGLKEFLARALPHYMIPTFFVPVEKMPLTATGKLNRAALPEPELKAKGHYTAPKNEIEEELVEIWAQVLGIEKNQISIDVNLFELGANSLKIITVNNRIKEQYNIDIPAALMFKYNNILMLAQYLQDGGKKMDDDFNQSKIDIRRTVDRAKNRIREKKKNMQ